MATDLESFVEADGRADLVKEVRSKIDAEGVTYVYYQFVSVTGRIMGKGVPAHTGSPSSRRASSSSTGRRRTSSSTATATTSATAPRPGSWSASRSRRLSRCCPGIRG